MFKSYGRTKAWDLLQKWQAETDTPRQLPARTAFIELHSAQKTEHGTVTEGWLVDFWNGLPTSQIQNGDRLPRLDYSSLTLSALVSRLGAKDAYTVTKARNAVRDEARKQELHDLKMGQLFTQEFVHDLLDECAGRLSVISTGVFNTTKMPHQIEAELIELYREWIAGKHREIGG